MLTDNAGYHTAGGCKASGKLLGPNKVKASMCEQSLSLSLKDCLLFAILVIVPVKEFYLMLVGAHH